MFDVKLYLYINNSKTANFFLPFLTFFWYKSQLMYKKKVVLMVDSSKVDVALIISSKVDVALIITSHVTKKTKILIIIIFICF